MASSSSPSLPSSSAALSSSWSWNYEVFLSFRGEDTRKTFVDHLYFALDQQGIYTYKDDETLTCGESISPSLLKAIEESRIAVIVFSKNYADSSWCLDELALIMKCRDERGQTVMPIFYDVDPSEVRKQEGEFGKAFSKQELKNISKVDLWRKALVDAASLSGWEPKHMANGCESRCIKIIVDTISHILRPLISSANENLIGIETRMQDLRSRLEIGSGGVRMVGIWGVGGGGKTTLASSVYNEISPEFHGCCFVENIREESSKYGLKKLQERILSDVLKLKQVGVESVMIMSRLRHKNVLIVLDDVDQLDQLKALAGSHDWFGEGSRIIITTRDEHLLNVHKVDVIYHIRLLNDDEAIQLFRRHAFGEFRPIEDYEKLSQDVISYAGGLPLALEVLGSFLCDKDMSEWRSALARLKDIPDTDIVGKLKISYDRLQHEEKELFLDLACFFRRCPKDEAMMILDACGFHPVIGVKVLIQKALVTISNGRFDMHDLVQEMGHYIIRAKHPNNPEKHSRVWRYEDVLNICSMDATTVKENDNIEALTFYFEDDHPPRLPQVLANMKKLRLIHVGSFNYKLLKGIEFLSNELRWITWYGYPASLLPTNFQPTKLGGLILEGGLQKQLWKGCKHLPSLKVLDLSYSCNLIKTPDFNGLPCLERMILSYCKDLEEMHPSIRHLERLVYLNLKRCYKLKMFPPITRLTKLETLILSYCSQLRKFPDIQMSMDSLVKLCLDGSGIEVVPSSIGQYCTSLVSLDLSYCSHLKSIEGNFRLLKRLRRLKLDHCTRLEKLPNDLYDVECCLEELSLPSKRQSPSSQHLIMKLSKNLMRCKGLQFFHRDLGGLEFPHLPRFLRKLDLRWCKLVDGDIPSDICELSNLQVLYLRGNEFSRLHSSLSQLPRLKYLNLAFCKRLVELPELPSSIAILKAEGCDSLEIVGDLPTNCKWLWKVSLRRENRQCVIGDDKVLQSMLQGNAIENHFMSLSLPGYEIAKGFVPSLVKGNTFTLQLPSNWHIDFSGFLMCAAFMSKFKFLSIKITIKQEMGATMGMNSQSELWKESDEAVELDYCPTTSVGYVSFSSLSHTAWWNLACNTISFSFHNKYDEILEVGFGVGLVPRKSKGDLVETTKYATDCPELSDEEHEDMRTFTIEHDSKSTMKISWVP